MVRAQILKEATRLFAERGYDGTSVQEIADAVGIRKPSLLYHFNSKDKLRDSVFGEIVDHWNAKLPSLLLQASRQERFDATMESLCEFFLEDPDRARVFLREILDRPEPMRELLQAFVRPWVELVADQLARAKERGLVRAEVDPEAYAVQVLTMIVSGIAVIDTLSVILPDDPELGATHARHVRELVRVARSSLFNEERSNA
jgi:TetR/AcrR family transcriptional regulator